MGSQEGSGEEGTPPIDWAATGAIMVGAVLCAAAIITGVLIMGIVGAVILAIGGGWALFGGMLNRVEEYPSGNREDVG